MEKQDWKTIPTEVIVDKMYESEINFSISAFFNAGFTVEIGDDFNGFNGKVKNLQSFSEAVNCLAMNISRIYPISDFTTWFLNSTNGEFYMTGRHDLLMVK